MGTSESDLGAILPVWARTWALWGPSWNRLGRSWGERRGNLGRGSAVRRRSVAPPRDFLRKFLSSRDLNFNRIKKGSSQETHNTPCCAGGGQFWLVFGSVLAALGTLSVTLETLLAALGSLLCQAWAALGGSWVALEPLWGALGLLLRISWPH